MSNEVKQIVEEKLYESLSEIAKEYGLSKRRIYKRHSRGKRGDDLIPKAYRRNASDQIPQRKNSFKVGQRSFPSAAAACRSLDVNYGVFQSRIRGGWTREEALGIVPRQSNRKTTQRKRARRIPATLSLFGITFKTYAEVARYTGMKPYVISQRVTKYSMSLEEAVLWEGKKKSVIVGGKCYTSTADFARELGIDASLMYSLLNRLTPAEIANGAHLHSRHSVIFKGVHYPNLKALASRYDLSVGQLRYRRNACGGDLETALAIPSGERPVNIIFGNSAHLYITEFPVANGVRFKIGVTQYPLEKRYAEFPFECRTILRVDGKLQTLRKREKSIKKYLDSRRCRSYSAADFDGFSEVYELSTSELKVVRFLAKFGNVPVCAAGEMGLKP